MRSIPARRLQAESAQVQLEGLSTPRNSAACIIAMSGLQHDAMLARGFLTNHNDNLDNRINTCESLLSIMYSGLLAERAA
jgi:hypothetical protein